MGVAGAREVSEGNAGHLTRDPDLEMRIEACMTCQKMIAKDGQPCARHGGPSRGPSWEQRSPGPGRGRPWATGVRKGPVSPRVGGGDPPPPPAPPYLSLFFPSSLSLS